MTKPMMMSVAANDSGLKEFISCPEASRLRTEARRACLRCQLLRWIASARRACGGQLTSRAVNMDVDKACRLVAVP